MIGYSLAVINSFLFNRSWTFSKFTSGHRIHLEFILFLLGNLIGLILSTVVVFYASSFIPPILGKVLAIIVGLPWNYWYSRKFVFNKGGVLSNE